MFSSLRLNRRQLQILTTLNAKNGTKSGIKSGYRRIPLSNSWWPLLRNTSSVRALPEPIDAYIQACNSWDVDGLITTFVDDALVNDQLQDYWGKLEIERWATRDILGDRLLIEVISARLHYGHIILTANIDGEFDKRGLPDPLAHTFYFALENKKIAQLIILRNRSGT